MWSETFLEVDDNQRKIPKLLVFPKYKLFWGLSESTIEGKVDSIYEVIFLSYLWVCHYEMIPITLLSLCFTINIPPFYIMALSCPCEVSILETLHQPLWIAKSTAYNICSKLHPFVVSITYETHEETYF